jgi:UDP-glucose 4-epimerase
MAVILVTGGCGFIGSHVVDALVARGDTVRVIDNLSSSSDRFLPPSATLLVGDVADTGLLEKAMTGCDGIIHLAAIASVQICQEQWVLSHRTNVLGCVSVFDTAARHAPHAPVIYASSAAIYGDNPNTPLRETEAPTPLTSYGTDKWANERYAQIAHRYHGISNVGLRFFNVYGPRQDPSSPYSGVISRFMHASTAQLPITVYGDGEQTRDFIHVSDIVRLILAALDYARNHDGAHIFNGCSGTETSLLALVEHISALKETALVARHTAPRAGDIRRSTGNPEKAAKTLGFTGQMSLKKGLQDIF